MKKIIIPVIMLLAVVFSCSKGPFLKNQTRATGYALGENILLSFKTNVNPPDSIQAFVFEKKSGFVYVVWAKKGGCDSLCTYSTMWDGRKPDGSWAMGGVYQVYAKVSDHHDIFSDTVQIGLGD